MQEYEKQYTKIECIGGGNFGKAYLVRNNNDQQLYVAKAISFEGLSKENINRAIHEANILRRLQHPHIVTYKDSFNFSKDLIIIMEYCESMYITLS